MTKNLNQKNAASEKSPDETDRYEEKNLDHVHISARQAAKKKHQQLAIEPKRSYRRRFSAPRVSIEKKGVGSREMKPEQTSAPESNSLNVTRKLRDSSLRSGGSTT